MRKIRGLKVWTEAFAKVGFAIAVVLVLAGSGLLLSGLLGTARSQFRLGFGVTV